MRMPGPHWKISERVKLRKAERGRAELRRKASRQQGRHQREERDHTLGRRAVQVSESQNSEEDNPSKSSSTRNGQSPGPQVKSQAGKKTCVTWPEYFRLAEQHFLCKRGNFSGLDPFIHMLLLKWFEVSNIPYASYKTDLQMLQLIFSMTWIFSYLLLPFHIPHREARPSVFVMSQLTQAKLKRAKPALEISRYPDIFTSQRTPHFKAWSSSCFFFTDDHNLGESVCLVFLLTARFR